MNTLADKVSIIKKELTGSVSEIVHVDTPRNEQTTNHYYYYNTKILNSFGYVPTRSLEDEIYYSMKYLLERKDKLEGLKKNLIPNISFK
jgi:nucleoside-diphosphate-sugar epimerase